MNTEAAVPKIPFPRIEEAYNATREKIKALRAQAEEQVAPILEQIALLEEKQKAKEGYLFEHGDIEAFGFVTALYLNGRDDKAISKKKEQDLGVDMKKMEAWLLKMLSKVGDSIKTPFGTVYKTRKESVGVSDFDAYLASQVLRPLAVDLVASLQLAGDAPTESAYAETVEQVVERLKTIFPVDAITKAANKSFVLEQMGDQDEKTSARPNPPPPGIDYKAFATVGVRKAK